MNGIAGNRLDETGERADRTGSAALVAGTRLGKYEIVRLVGEGSMGAVYEAVHGEIGKRVAIKVLSPLLAAMPEARARFLREAHLTTRVRHPHIIDVTDVGTDGGHTYLVMQLLSGEDLAQRLQGSGPLTVEEMADIMLPVCDAVAAAHRNDVTHRDLKPSNIFLAVRDRRTHPTVLDFGISTTKADDAGNLLDPPTKTAAGTVFGTPYYLAPEQVVDSRSAGPASDQYALGVICYECLTGRRPFDGGSLYAVLQAIVAGYPRPPRAHRPEIPPALEDIVLKAMKHFPTARFASVMDFGRALVPFASSRSRLFWEESFEAAGARTQATTLPASPSNTTLASAPAPIRRPAPSPSTVAEASTPSPFVRTLTPEVQKVTGAWAFPSEVPEAVSSETTMPTPNPWPIHAEATNDDLARSLVPASSRKWISMVVGGLAVSVVGVALFSTRGGSADRSGPDRPRIVAAPAAAPAAAPVTEAARPATATAPTPAPSSAAGSAEAVAKAASIGSSALRTAVSAKAEDAPTHASTAPGIEPPPTTAEPLARPLELRNGERRAAKSTPHQLPKNGSRARGNVEVRSRGGVPILD